MKRIIAVLLAPFLLATPVFAQVFDEKVGNFLYRYDIDSATLTFCKLVGRNGDPFGGALLGTARIKTTGSSTSVAAVTAGQNPFANVAADDVLIVRRPAGGIDVRVVTVRTDADNVTVETPVNWDQTTGFVFSWFDSQCGTTDADGWIDASNPEASRTVTYLVEQIGTTSGVDMRIECKTSGLGATPQQVYPASGFTTHTTAGIANKPAVDVAGRFSACRVGLKLNTTDDGSDTVTERISATIVK